MRRGDLVTVAMQGEHGKPRPALVVQADRFADLAPVTVLPITGTLLEAPLLRVGVEPSPRNGLTKRSQVMVDKPQTPPCGKVGAVIGRLDDATMLAVNRALACSSDSGEADDAKGLFIGEPAVSGAIRLRKGLQAARRADASG